MYSQHVKRRRNVAECIKWHIAQGYTPVQIDVSDPKISMLVMINENQDELFPDTAFICFHPLGYDAVKQQLLKLGYDTMFVQDN